MVGCFTGCRPILWKMRRWCGLENQLLGSKLNNYFRFQLVFRQLLATYAVRLSFCFFCAPSHFVNLSVQVSDLDRETEVLPDCSELVRYFLGLHHVHGRVDPEAHGPFRPGSRSVLPASAQPNKGISTVSALIGWFITNLSGMISMSYMGFCLPTCCRRRSSYCIRRQK